MWCPNPETWTGKDSQGVRIYTCDEHRHKIKTEARRLIQTEPPTNSQD
jgi:hypothetical protein